MIELRLLENALSDQREELRQKSRKHYCMRQEEQLVDLNSAQAQVVIGVRRSGKSTLCYNVLRRAGVNFAYVNFDDERLASLAGADLNAVLEVLYKLYGNFTHLFLDEIQNIPEWYLFVNRLLRREIRVLVTGSNAKLLSGELATHLTGRHHAITLYPFSFADHCAFKNVDTTSHATQAVAERRAAFDNYLTQGGFPELYTVSNHMAYIDGLVDSILKRDIEQRFKLSYKAAFERMAQHLMNIVPTIVSESSLRSLFELGSPHTVKNYLGYLQQAYMLLAIDRYSTKSRLRVTGQKLYAVDVSLMDQRQGALAGLNSGWRLETVVLIELLRRAKRNGRDVLYYRERSCECDFLVCRGRVVEQAVQVCYDLENPRTLRREVNALLAVARATNCQQLLLVTDHHYMDLVEEGYTIAVRPAYDWLLNM